MGIFSIFKKKPEIRDLVAFNDQEVTHTRPDGLIERIRWDELEEVGIVTTDEGPWCEDVFFLLLGPDRKTGCAVPQSCEGSQKLLERLQQLPGFNNAAVIEAMGSAENNSFLCWKRTP